MNGSRDLAYGHIRTAIGFEHASVAVVLSGGNLEPALREKLMEQIESEAAV